MKVIQPVEIWSDGQVRYATLFLLTSYFDNLSTYASFTYQLMDDAKLTLGTGTLQMCCDVYDNWETNEYAYDWATQQLHLTVISDWTTTTTTSTTTSTTTENIITSSTTTSTTKP